MLERAKNNEQVVFLKNFKRTAKVLEKPIVELEIISALMAAVAAEAMDGRELSVKNGLTVKINKRIVKELINKMQESANSINDLLAEMDKIIKFRQAKFIKKCLVEKLGNADTIFSRYFAKNRKMDYFYILQNLVRWVDCDGLLLMQIREDMAERLVNIVRAGKILKVAERKGDNVVHGLMLLAKEVLDGAFSEVMESN